MIKATVDRLCDKLSTHSADNSVIDLDASFAALTADIITKYFYGTNPDYLGSPGFKFKVRDAILGLIGYYHFSRFFPTVASAVKRLPIQAIRLIQPGAADLLTSQQEIRDQILDGLSQKTAKPSRAVILQAFMNENVPRNETSIDRLQDEGTTIIFAGTETTARALSVMMFHVTNDPKHLVQLRAELDATSDPSLRDITVTALEKLPYLVRATSRTTISTPLTITIQTGVINEGLRLSHGPLIRLPRVATHDTLRYGNYRIPPGVSITRPLRSLSAKN
jgi:cytochrome P450